MKQPLKQTVKKVALFAAMVTTFSLFGCSELAWIQNRAPVLINAVTDLSIPKNDTIELTLEHVDAYDANGDEMTLIVNDGDKYTVVLDPVSGQRTTKLVPEKDFIGNIYVTIKVRDTEGAESSTRTIIISVLPGIRQQILPLYTGATWSYLDTFHTLNSADTSNLTVVGPYVGSVTGVSSPIFRLRWSGLTGFKTTDLSSDTIDYLFADTDSGLVAAGGKSQFDLFDKNPNQFARYPVTIGQSWNYQALEYNTSLKRFFLDTTMTTTKCLDTAIYITVPAGTFKCVRYQYDFKQLLKSRSADRSITIQGISIPVPATLSRADQIVTATVNLYYALGVGYVKNETYVSGVKVYTKALRKYSVEEKK